VVLDGVELWVVDPATCPPARAEALARAHCPAPELAEASAIPHPRRRHEVLVTRVLVRRALAAATGAAPGALVLGRTPHERPVLLGPAHALDFSVAHTEGLVVCAVAHGASIGVDVEARARPARLELASTFFAPAEQAALAALPAVEQPARFRVLWTLKEAFVKALGLGLFVPLDQFSFTPDGQRWRVTLDPALAAHAAREGDTWRFELPLVTMRHVTALALRIPLGAKAPRVVVRWTDLDAP
jgi:4'-phosphopantetheinyl transferase